MGVLTLLTLPMISRKLGREMSTKSRCSQQEYIDIHTHRHIHKHSNFKPGVLSLMDFPLQEHHGISGSGARGGRWEVKCATVGCRFGCHHI